jgi:hypothetical protein
MTSEEENLRRQLIHDAVETEIGSVCIIGEEHKGN